MTDNFVVGKPKGLWNDMKFEVATCADIFIEMKHAY